MGIRLIPPPFASQGKAPHCWAACTTSWAAVHPDRPQKNLKELVERYGDRKKDGGISFQDEGYERLRKDMRWANTFAVEVVLLPPKKRGLELTLTEFADTVEATLFDRGYQLLVDNHTPGTPLSQGISHMYVVFGVSSPASGGHELLVMDPSPSQRKRVSVAEFIGHHVALIGTLEKITTKRFNAINAGDPDK